MSTFDLLDFMLALVHLAAQVVRGAERERGGKREGKGGGRVCVCWA